MAMLFSQMERLVRQDDTISLMKVGQLCGQSCLRMETSTRFSLPSSVRCVRNASSELELWMMKLTTKLRMPSLPHKLFIRHTQKAACGSTTDLDTAPVVEPSSES